MNSNIRKFWLIISPIILLGLLVLSYFSTTLALMALALLIFWFIFWWKNEFGLYLLILVLPVIHWVFYIEPFEISLVDLVGLVLLIGIILQKVYQFLSCGNFTWKSPFVKQFALFIFVSILSSLFSNFVQDSIWYAIRWILFFYLVYICLPYNIIKSEKVLRNSIIALSLSAIVFALLGLWSLWGQDWHEAFFRIEPMALGGIYVFGSNHNLIAEFLVMAAFVMLSLRYWLNPKQKLLVNWLFIFLVVIAVGTFSRSAWIILLIQGIIFLHYSQRNFFKKYFIPIIIVFMLALVPIATHMLNLQQANVSSNENRWLLTQISWQAFENKPILGQGTGSFVNLVSDNIRFKAKYGEPLDSHGVWQKVLAENGALGIITFIIFIVAIFSYIFKAVKKYPKYRELLLPLAVGSLGAFLFQFLNTSYYKGKVWLPVALTLAAIALVKNNYVSNKSKN